MGSMANNTTIGISNDVKMRLDKLKVIPREPYNDVIKKLLDKHEKEIKP